MQRLLTLAAALVLLASSSCATAPIGVGPNGLRWVPQGKYRLTSAEEALLDELVQGASDACSGRGPAAVERCGLVVELIGMAGRHKDVRALHKEVEGLFSGLGHAEKLEVLVAATRGVAYHGDPYPIRQYLNEVSSTYGGGSSWRDRAAAAAAEVLAERGFLKKDPTMTGVVTPPMLRAAMAHDAAQLQVVWRDNAWRAAAAPDQAAILRLMASRAPDWARSKLREAQSRTEGLLTRNDALAHVVASAELANAQAQLGERDAALQTLSAVPARARGFAAQLLLMHPANLDEAFLRALAASLETALATSPTELAGSVETPLAAIAALVRDAEARDRWLAAIPTASGRATVVRALVDAGRVGEAGALARSLGTKLRPTDATDASSVFEALLLAGEAEQAVSSATQPLGSVGMRPAIRALVQGGGYQSLLDASRRCPDRANGMTLRALLLWAKFMEGEPARKQ